MFFYLYWLCFYGATIKKFNTWFPFSAFKRQQQGRLLKIWIFKKRKRPTFAGTSRLLAKNDLDLIKCGVSRCNRTSIRTALFSYSKMRMGALIFSCIHPSPQINQLMSYRYMYEYSWTHPTVWYYKNTVIFKNYPAKSRGISSDT